MKRLHNIDPVSIGTVVTTVLVGLALSSVIKSPYDAKSKCKLAEGFWNANKELCEDKLRQYIRTD